MKQKSIIIIIISFFLTFSCSTQQEEPATPTLTDDQWKALQWVDWGAGMASAELGPVSFAIAGAASLAYYYDNRKVQELQSIYEQLPEIKIKQDMLSNSDNFTKQFDKLGEDHNNLCKAYLSMGYKQLALEKVLELAKNVRPDLTEELNKITVRQLKNTVENTMTINFLNANTTIEFIKRKVLLSSVDSDVLKIHFENLLYEKNQKRFEQEIINLYHSIEKFSLSEFDKINLKNSFSILKHSSRLWKNLKK